MYLLNDNEIIGAVKNLSEWKFYACTVAEWIMDYKSYDPTYTPENWPVKFRDNILLVDSDNANEFMFAIKDQQLSLADIKYNIKQQEGLSLSILIDFDEKLYVSSYYDLSLEIYIPRHWNGIFDDPLKYVPENIKKMFKN